MRDENDPFVQLRLSWSDGSKSKQWRNHLLSKLRIHCNALRLQQSQTHCLKQLFLVIAEHWATFIEWTSLSCVSFYICSFRSLLLVGFKLKGVLLFSSAFPCALPACFCWCTSLYLKDGQLAKLGFYLPFLYLLPSTALSLNGSPLTDPPLTFWRQNLNLRRIWHTHRVQSRESCKSLKKFKEMPLQITGGSFSLRALTLKWPGFCSVPLKGLIYAAMDVEPDERVARTRD